MIGSIIFYWTFTGLYCALRYNVYRKTLYVCSYCSTCSVCVRRCLVNVEKMENEKVGYGIMPSVKDDETDSRVVGTTGSLSGHLENVHDVKPPEYSCSPTDR